MNVSDIAKGPSMHCRRNAKKRKPTESMDESSLPRCQIGEANRINHRRMDAAKGGEKQGGQYHTAQSKHTRASKTRM